MDALVLGSRSAARRFGLWGGHAVVMTRAWLPLAAVVASACAGTRPATTPWGLAPAALGECLPAEIANESCYPETPLAAPLIVGPGRIEVVTDIGLSREGEFKRGVPARDQIHFFVDDITRAGHQAVAVGRCPGHLALSAPLGLVQTASGETAVLCLEDGKQEGCVEQRGFCTPPEADDGPEEPWDCTPTRSCAVGFVHFGVIDRARHSVDWRWRDEIDGAYDRKTIHVAPLGTGGAIVYQTIQYPPAMYPEGWLVKLAPHGEDLSLWRSGETGDLDGFLVADGNLHLVLGRGGWEQQYRQVTITPDGRMWASQLDQAGPLGPGPLAHACAAAGADRSVTLSLPYWAEGEFEPETPSRMLTLRFSNAFLPAGPEVFPSARAACAPRGRSDRAPTAVASFDDQGPLIVYTVDDAQDRPTALRVDRRAH